jgi:hypothetical protein
VEAVVRTFNELLSRAGFEAPVRIIERRRPWRMWARSSCVEFAFGAVLRSLT